MIDDKALARILDLNHHLAQRQSPQAFFQAAVNTARDLTEADHSLLAGYHQAQNSLFALATTWTESANEIRLPLHQSAAGWIFQYEQPLNLDNVLKDRPGFMEPNPIAPQPFKALLGVPILFRGQALGVLEIFRQEKPFNFEDLAILEHIAVIAAMALENLQSQAQIKRLNHEIARLDDMKANFIAIASHELRTPLGLILGHATFLKEIIPPEFQEQMDVVVNNAVRLKKLIESMSKVNNYQSGTAIVQQETFSLHDTLLAAIQSFEAMARAKNITIQPELPNDALLFHGDKEKLQTAFGNIIHNGITFNQPGGYLKITAKRIPGYIRLVFADSGIGIPKEELPRIFDRFYQVESHLTRQHDGIGLGLSVTKAMVELHGGRIWAESTPGQGSVFTVLLPAHTLPVQPAKNKRP